jgi:prevent-host-death family protein
MAARLLPKTHLRERIRDELAHLGDDTVVVTDRGRPSAIVVSVERWNELQETLEELQDSLAVFEHRAEGHGSAPAEHVFSSIEAELADVRRPARHTS